MSTTINLTDNTTASFAVDGGKEVAYKAVGTFGSGTISIQDADGDEIDSITADKQELVFCVTDKLNFVLSGATSPDIDIKVTESEM